MLVVVAAAGHSIPFAWWSKAAEVVVFFARSEWRLNYGAHQEAGGGGETGEEEKPPSAKWFEASLLISISFIAPKKL